MQPSLFGEPKARTTDPQTSRLAAASVVPANDELIKRIREAARLYGPLTAFDIARIVDKSQPGRWDTATIRTAVSRAGLHVWDKADGLSPRGRRCSLYTLPVLETRPL